MIRARLTRALLVGATLASLAACTLSPPAIQNVAPHKDENNVAADAPVQITFDRPMDQNSVNSRFELRPAVAGCNPTICPVTWREQTMTWSHPGYELLPATRYTVVLRGGYRDAAARVNTLDHSWDFTTEEAPRVRASSPSNGATGVATDAEISLQFTRAMSPLGPDVLTLAPPDEFRVTSDPADPSRVIIRPVRLLQARTHYEIMVDATATDAHHNALSAAYHLDFTTGAQDLTRTLAFAVLDANGQALRLAVLRPPATLGSPRPGLRVVYQGPDPIKDFAFGTGARSLYVLSTDQRGAGHLNHVELAGEAGRQIADGVRWMAVTRTGDAVAYVDGAALLHIWSVSGGDVSVAQVGRVLGAPAWSGDGTRLALAIDAGGGGATEAVTILDRASLGSYRVPGITTGSTPACDSCRALAWSLDGSTLLVAGSDGGPGLFAYHPLSAGGSGLQRVSSGVPLDVTWSADGASIYAALDGGIARTPARPAPGQTSGLALIAGSRAGDESPAPPTFDRRLAFLRPADGHPQLFLMNNDGTGVVQLTFPDYDATDQLVTYGVTVPRWAPAS